MKNPNTSENHALPPGRLGLPWLGETLSFLTQTDFIDQRRRRYGPIFKTQILGRPTIIMVGPEANRFILSSHSDRFSNQGWPDSFKSLLGQKALVIQDGPEHQRSRKLLMPSLHGPALANYLTTMERVSLAYLARWETQETITWFPELKKMTFEMASRILLGSEPGEENDRLFQWFGTLSQGLFSPTTSWQWTPYGKALHAREQILAYIDRAINQRQTTPTQDVLSLLMQAKDEAGEGLSLEEIKSQALSLLIGTNANTASMLVCLCMALAQKPEVLQIARSEQQEIAQDGTLSLEQIKGMTYLNQVLQEVERLYPPVGAGFRSTIVPFEFQGYCVPVGWNVMYSIIGTHMDAEIYPEPLRFDPDRFSVDRAEHKKQEFSLIGFGGGARSCLGFAFAQTLVKAFAALLIRGYDWEILAGQDLRLDRIPTASPRSGLQVRLKKIV